MNLLKHANDLPDIFCYKFRILLFTDIRPWIKKNLILVIANYLSLEVELLVVYLIVEDYILKI